MPNSASVGRERNQIPKYLGFVWINEDDTDMMAVASGDAEDTVTNVTRNAFEDQRANNPDFDPETAGWDVYKSTRSEATVRHPFEGPGASPLNETHPA